jgi:hypothetical protein
MPVNPNPLYAAWPQLEALRDEIAPHYSWISYGDSDDDSWGTTVTTAGTILTAHDEHLESCLAHELLHLWLQARGYRRIRRGVSSFDETGWLGQFITALDNELQHHRMFPRYLALGLDPRWFYGSSDQQTAACLEAQLANPHRDIKSMVLAYLTCIAPGGELTPDEAAQFNKRLHEDSGGAYHERLAVIDAAFAEWRAAWFTLNAEPFVRQIMLSLENPTRTWFGYGAFAAFPENGFFVGEPFETP